MKTRIALLACLMASLPVMAQEIGTVGKPAPDFRFTLRDSSNSGDGRVFSIRDQMLGRITVIYYFRLPNLASIEMLDRMAEIGRSYRGKGVRFILMCADKADLVKDAVEAIDLPERYYFVGSLFRRVAEQFGIMSAPGVCIIDQWGRIAWRGDPDDPLGTLEERLDDIIRRTNPRGADERWINRQMQKAQELRDQKEYGKAYSVAERIKRMTDGRDDNDENQNRSGDNDIGGFSNSSDFEKAKAFQSELETKAEEWISEAIEAERKDDFERAAYIVSEIAMRFGKSEVARKAENEIGRMNGNRKIKELIRTASKNARGMVRVEDALFRIDEGEFEDAKEILRDVVKDYEDTDAAKLAKAELEKFDKDPARQKAVAEARKERDAEHLLSIGDHYFRIEMFGSARDSYNQLVKDYPNSTFVETAKSRLRKLPKEAAQAEQP